MKKGKMIMKIPRYFLLLIIPLSLSGQQAPVSDQYILNPFTINPAYAGARGALNFAAFYRRQWVGINGAPETLTVTADAPVLNGKLGVGLMLVNDKIGVTKETSVKTVYSYKIKTGEGNLSFGLGAGILATNTAWSDLTVVDPGDDYYLIDSKVFVVPDFSFGLYYTFKDYYAGLSVPRLLGYKFNFDKNKYSLKVNPGDYYYLFNTGYALNLNSKFRLFPSAMVAFSPGQKLLVDINAHISYIDRIWAGLSYRTNKSVGGLFQFAVNNQLKIAYSYYFDFNELRTYSNGTHEVMLRYEFRYQVKVVNPLIF